jgi:hypothetical protein
VKIIGIEEHFVTADIRSAWAASPIGQEGTGGFDRGEIEERLDDLGEQRLALMDESGVDVQVLSVTTPALHKRRASPGVGSPDVAASSRLQLLSWQMAQSAIESLSRLRIGIDNFG